MQYIQEDSRVVLSSSILEPARTGHYVSEVKAGFLGPHPKVTMEEHISKASDPIMLVELEVAAKFQGAIAGDINKRKVFHSMTQGQKIINWPAIPEFVDSCELMSVIRESTECLTTLMSGGSQEVLSMRLRSNIWDPGGHFYIARTFSSIFLKVWDPGGSSAILY